MLRKKQLSLILGTGALALLANAPFAQTSSSNDQTVSPSASSSVDANTQFKAMPHSTVTVSPNATTNQTTSTNQSTSTTGVTDNTGTGGSAKKSGTATTNSGSTRAGAGATGTASAGSSSGSHTGGAAVAGGSTSSSVVTDRNPNSPGKGWAKGRDKHDKDQDAHDNDQDSGKTSTRR